MPATPAATRARVLLIDDERPYLEVLREFLKREYEVEIAESTAEATEILKTRQFDLVVCDHMMPGESGLEFLTRTTQAHPRMRRIMMTGYLNPELLSRSVPQAQLSSLILKPVGAVELSQLIRSALNRDAGR